jgi:hypothetical protein
MHHFDIENFMDFISHNFAVTSAGVGASTEKREGEAVFH